MMSDKRTRTTSGLAAKIATTVVIIGIVLTAVIWPYLARADYLVADLSKRRIDITLGFSGAEVLLFGATDGGGDVVVVVRGPKQPVVVRKKERFLGIWANHDWMRFNDVPAYYYVASSKPLETIASHATLSRIEVGFDSIPLTPSDASPGADAESFRAALIGAKERQGLYSTGPGQVTYIGGRLFRTTVSFPATVATGAYTVEVFLIRNGNIDSAQRWPLFITKVGLSAEVYDRAHKNSAFYGLIAIVIALMAGWLGAIGLRKA